MSHKIKLALFISIVLFIFSCSKNDEEKGYNEPIAVLTPATNPATTQKGLPISYKVIFSTDEYIDSIQTFLQIDSLGAGYSATKDSMIQKIVYPVGAKKNIQTVQSVATPWSFPAVGKSIYLTFWMRSENHFYTKTVKLEVV